MNFYYQIIILFEMKKDCQGYSLLVFEAGGNVIQKTFLTAAGKSVDLEIIDPTDINGSSVLRSTTTEAETTGTLEGLELYILDSAGPSVLMTNVTVVYQFLSQNDPPAIQAQIPAGGLQLIKNSSTALEIDISSWKIDADTPQNQLCFDVASYDSLMIFPSFPQGYGPPFRIKIIALMINYFCFLF